MSITCPSTGCGYSVEGSDLKHCPRCGAYLPPAVVDSTDPLIGQPIVGGKFRIISLLGEGGMGKVYKGVQKLGTAERPVAIKTLQPDLAQDAQIVARFHRETETVVQLEHPNTIKFYDFGELPDGKLFIAMEFIQGESLAHVIARGAMTPQKTEHILQQICGSLAEAHEHNIVHRDLKPENIILTQKGQKGDFVKVLDFGIAKRNEADDAASAKLTRQGMVLGTPPYMSPEQFTGQSLKATSDIYSLAIMAYEMLTGVLPYTASTPWEWATRHLTGTPTPFEQQPNGASVLPRHKAAVMRALSRNPLDRPQTTTEFLQQFTGNTNAGGDWAQSTSTGQGYNSGPAAPANIPTPSPFGQPTPVPRSTTAAPSFPGQQGYNPGGQQNYTPPPQPTYNPTVAANFGPNNPFGQVPSSPGFVPAPSNAGFQAINAPPSNPGFNQMQNAYAQPMYSNPGYSSQGTAQNTGGGAGKLIAIIAVVFLVLAGAGIAGIRAMGSDDNNNNNNNNSNNNNNNNNGNYNNNGSNGNNGFNPPPPPPNNIQPIPTPPNNNVVMAPVPPPNPPQQIDPVPNNPVPNNPVPNNPVPTAPPRPRCPGSASRIDDLILNGNCSRAQAMFRAMRASGCSGGAGDSFGSACPQP